MRTDTCGCPLTCTLTVWHMPYTYTHTYIHTHTCIHTYILHTYTQTYILILRIPHILLTTPTTHREFLKNNLFRVIVSIYAFKMQQSIPPIMTTVLIDPFLMGIVQKGCQLRKDPLLCIFFLYLIKWFTILLWSKIRSDEASNCYQQQQFELSTSTLRDLQGLSQSDQFPKTVVKFLGLKSVISGKKFTNSMSWIL